MERAALECVCALQLRQHALYLYVCICISVYVCIYVYLCVFLCIYIFFLIHTFCFDMHAYTYVHVFLSLASAL